MAVHFSSATVRTIAIEQQLLILIFISIYYKYTLYFVSEYSELSFCKLMSDLFRKYNLKINFPQFVYSRRTRL